MPNLLSEPQTIARLKWLIERSSLTEVAKKYKISPQQLSDITHGRARLSDKAMQKLRIRLHRYYEFLEPGQ